MSYVSLLKSIPEALSQPTGIAAIAAVGVHGAIALIVPLMPVDSSQPKQTEPSKTVGLLELSPADQSRLPQTPENSPLALQSVPIQKQPGMAFNLGNQPQGVLTPGTQLPVVPNSGKTYRTTKNPRGQSVQLTPGGLALGGSDFKVNPNYYSSVGRYNNRPNQVAPGKPLNIDRLPQQGKLNNQRSGGSPEPLIEPADVDPMTTAQDTKTQVSMIGGDNGAKVNQNQQFTALNSSQQGTGNIGTAGTSLQQYAVKQAPIPFSSQGIIIPSSQTSSQTGTRIAQTKTFAQQLAQAKKNYSGIETKKLIAETVNKPGLEGKVEGSLVVDSEGKIDFLKFQDDSVSPALQTAAKEYLRAYFQQNPSGGNGKPKFYPFRLSFQSPSNNKPEQNSVKKPTPGADSQPTSQPQNRSNQPAPSPAASPTTTPSPTNINTQPAPSPAASPTTTSSPTNINTQPKFSTDPAKKLIERLREGKKETGSPEKQ